MTANATALRNRLIARARFRNIFVFVKTAELGSMRLAAEAAGMAQPSASQSLAELEALLESPLFLRHSRGMALTAAGRALLPLARRLLDAMDEGAHQVAALQGASSGMVRIAAIAAAVHGLLVEALGARFATPQAAPTGADVVFHTSASSAGLNTAIAACGLEATLVELSWYGTSTVNVDLGGAFHSRRIRLVSSQVGQVAPSRRPRWTHRRRLEKALAILRDNPVLDRLVAASVTFATLPAALPGILTSTRSALPPVVCYETS